MTSMSHDAPRRLGFSVPAEFWPSLAIIVVWLAVLFDGVFGPSLEYDNGAGTNTSSTPSAVVIAAFAFLATWVIARNGYRREPKG